MWIDGHPTVECFKCGGYIVLDDINPDTLEEKRNMVPDRFELESVEIGHKTCPMDSHNLDANL